jgi:hypothetical protein
MENPMTGCTQPVRPARSTDRSLLRAGTALAAALALAGYAAPAQAQGFNGTVVSQTGASVNVTNNDITVLQSEAIINWNATGASAADTNVDFLPVNNTVLFHDLGSSSSSYTVLNRINPTYTDTATGSITNLAATISLSGTVSSTLNGGQGGNIWFYSPYGIITNGSSTFNVGSLLLTTSDIDTSSGSLYLSQTSGQQIGFVQASQPNSFVRILSGTQINAVGDPTQQGNSAYVGVFAPRIEQGGTITSDGATGLVAAEAGTITFNFGLVSGSVSVGTSDPNGIVHTGSTGGPASTGEVQTVALVAIPKNTAMTMLLGGSIGYTPAASAIVDGSSVLLISGYDTALPAATLAAGYGNIEIDSAIFSSAVGAQATGGIDVSFAASGLTEFQNGATLAAGKSISLTANAGQEISVIGDLNLQPLFFLQAPDISLTVTGAAVSPPPPGQINVTGTLFAGAEASPDFNAPVPSIGANATGGTITVSVSQGTLSADNGMSLIANGRAENGTDQGGNGTGGSITVSVDNGGTIRSSGFIASASGFAGSGSGLVTTSIGGTGTGGTISLSDGTTATGFGTLDFVSVSLDAQAEGGGGVASSGSATGGKIGVTIGQTQTWSSLDANASAYNGFGFLDTTNLGSAAGRADGLNLKVSGVNISLNLGTLTLNNNVGMFGGSGAAHSGQAGGIDVTVDTGASLLVSGLIDAHADANPPADSSPPNGDFAPVMTGGTISIIADSGTVTADQLIASANATQFGAGVTGAIARGGSVTLGARNNASIQLTGTSPNTLSAEAYGAIGPAGTPAAFGFSIGGGTAQVFASDSSITGPGLLRLSASAVSGGQDFAGNRSGIGYSAVGGLARIETQSGTSGTAQIGFGTIEILSQATATIERNPDVRNGPASFFNSDIAGIDGNGGQGNGGRSQVVVAAGTLSATTLTVYANGVGGSSGFAANGAPAWSSGTGFGGTASVTQTGGAINVTNLDVIASGHGGGYISTGNPGVVLPLPGTGVGGTARISLAAGTMTIAGGVNIFATGIGGEGASTFDPALNGGAGGSANSAGALAELLMPAGSIATFTTPTISIAANAVAGNGGFASVSSTGVDGGAGNAFAGTARFNLADGAFTVTGASEVRADAFGGTGSAIVDSGTAGFLLTDTLAAPATTRSLASLLLSSNPTGPTGAHRAGNIALTLRPGTAAAAPAILGNFTALAPGDAFFAFPGTGFTGDIGAFPVTVGGNVLIDTISDVGFTIASGGSLNASGTLTINGRTISSTGAGALSANDNVAINATAAIDLAVLKSGGTTLLSAQNPTSLAFDSVRVGDLNSTGLVTVRSSQSDIGSTGPLSFADSFATNGAFTVQTAGNLAVANITATGGAASLTSTGGTFTNSGTVSGAGITISSSGNATLSGPVTSSAALSLTSTAGTVTSTSTVSATGNVSVSGNAGVTLPSLVSGGTTLLQALNGAISLPSLTSPGAVTVTGRSANIASTGALTFADSATTAGDFTVQTAGNLAVAGVTTTGGAVSLTSTGGTFANTGTVSGAGITILAPGGATLSGPINSSAGLSINTSAGAITSTSTISATGNASVTGNTGISLSSLTSGGTTALNSASGSIVVGNLNSVGAVNASGTALNIGSTGSLQFSNANASTGDIAVTAAGNLQFGAAIAPGAITAQAGSQFTLSGLASGNTITVRSSDIQLGASAQLGERGTTSQINLISTALANGTRVGGASGQPGSWSLDAAEALRLFADNAIQISADGAAPADLVVGDLVFSYGPAVTSPGSNPNLGTDGLFGIFSAGRIVVTGSVAPTVTGSNDTFLLSGQIVDVISDTGTIALRTANETLSGRLYLSANSVRVVSAAALADIDSDLNLDQISARLDQNDGIIRDEGTISAGTINVFALSEFYVQNTGESTQFSARRGFTANSLLIDNEGTSIPDFDIAINGVINGELGPITGIDTQRSVLINGEPAGLGGPFNPRSTINGCLIGRECSISIINVAPSHPIIEELLKPPTVGGGGRLALSLAFPIVQYGSTPLIDSPPLIDEPVTGLGNDDLWQQR